MNAGDEASFLCFKGMITCRDAETDEKTQLIRNRLLAWHGVGDEYRIPVEQGIDGRHTHQCGVTVTGRIVDYGCGREFSHQRNEGKKIHEDHLCPYCGKGPWYFIVRD